LRSLGQHSYKVNYDSILRYFRVNITSLRQKYASEGPTGGLCEVGRVNVSRTCAQMTLAFAAKFEDDSILRYFRVNITSLRQKYGRQPLRGYDPDAGLEPQRAELVATAEQAKVPREVSVRSAV
jgi:hypothetical protein